MTTPPLISVVMPVYNGERFLIDAIKSILNQSLSNFEFLIIDDGSIDNTMSIINSFTDNRIRVIKQNENKGIVDALNKGIDAARGQYIARMDADDIALERRFEKQYSFMQSNPLTAVCGTQAFFIDDQSESIGELRTATNNDEISVNMIFNNSFIHSSTFFKSDILKEYKYSKEYQYAEDFHLFMRISLDHPVANLPDFLCCYRNHNNSTTNTLNDKMQRSKHKTQEYLLRRLLKNKYRTEMGDILFASGNYDFDSYKASEYGRLFTAIKRGNLECQFFNQDLLCKVLYEKWYEINIHKASPQNALLFLLSPLASGNYFILDDAKKIFRKGITKIQ